MPHFIDQTGDFCLITFRSTHHALKAEKILLEKGMEMVIIPTPREITSSCGLSIRVSCPQAKEVVGLLSLEKVDILQVYRFNPENREYLSMGMQ